jgi:hypothetical protein
MSLIYRHHAPLRPGWNEGNIGFSNPGTNEIRLKTWNSFKRLHLSRIRTSQPPNLEHGFVLLDVASTGTLLWINVEVELVYIYR